MKLDVNIIDNESGFQAENSLPESQIKIREGNKERNDPR